MSASYNQVRDELKTGDLVLFSGKGFISRLIQFGTRSKWSHVGMVIKIKELDFVALFESTTLSNIKDINTNTLKRGVQLVPLSERITKYDGEVAIRQLNKALTDDQINYLVQFRKNMQGKAYESSNLELIKSALDQFNSLTLNAEDLSTVFCSELVAEAYQSIGLLSEITPSNEFTPSDFAGHLPLNFGFEFLPLKPLC